MTAYHIVRNVVNKYDKKMLLHCKVHHSHYAVTTIQIHGYKPLFMPSYYSFLNLIVECWSKIKVYRKKLTLLIKHFNTQSLSYLYDYYHKKFILVGSDIQNHFGIDILTRSRQNEKSVRKMKRMNKMFYLIKSPIGRVIDMYICPPGSYQYKEE
jgi:hypothetical protein